MKVILDNVELTSEEQILVTGATGIIGSSLISYLNNKQLNVKALGRKSSELDLLPGDIECILGDIRDERVILKAMKDVDIVFHLAAKLHINNPGAEALEEYCQINVEGTRNIAIAAGREDVSRLVFFSTINVYGRGQEGVVFTENSDLVPDSMYARTKKAAEKLVLELSEDETSRTEGTVLRLGAVYGPSMKGNYLRLLRGLKQGWFLPIGDGSNRRTVIYIDDVIQGALLAAVHPAAAGEVYNLTDGKFYPLRRIIEAMCQALGRKSPNIHIPAEPVRFSAGILEDLANLAGNRMPIGRSTIDAMLEDRAVSGDKIKEELGFQAQVSLERGWQKVAESLF